MGVCCNRLRRPQQRKLLYAVVPETRSRSDRSRPRYGSGCHCLLNHHDKSSLPKISVRNRPMINLLRQLVTSFLSTIAFFAAFAIAGDVLIAAVVAIASAAAQFILATTTHGKPGGMKWASVAVILALTGTTLIGDDVDA